MIGTDPHKTPKQPERHPSYCAVCFTANQWQLRENYGTPRWFAIPQCDCLAAAAEIRIQRITERKNQNGNQND